MGGPRRDLLYAAAAHKASNPTCHEESLFVCEGEDECTVGLNQNFVFFLNFLYEKSKNCADLILHKSCCFHRNKKICYCKHFLINLLCFFGKQASFSLGFLQLQPLKKSTNLILV